MGSPLPANTPVLLVALQPLTQSAWSGPLPDVSAGDPFWASSREAPTLVADGYAEYPPPGTVAPPPEPAWTVRGTPGFGAGTSNCSHPWTPSPGGTADGGWAPVPGPQAYGGVIDGGPEADGGTPAGVLDGGGA